MRALRAVVSGRVQMVMYRDFARRVAHSFGIVGTVRNCDDGTVEVVAEGDESLLKSYVEKLNEGSLLSRVDKIDVTWHEPTHRFNDFTIQS